MLHLELRQEFLGKKLQGTAIELANEAKTGATQISAQDFLAITYPTHDLLKALWAIGPNQGRPVVVIGERGLGKSHILAALYHAVTNANATRAWLDGWASTLGDSYLTTMELRPDMRVIGESIHRQRHKFLWDLLFERHPHGQYIRGKWEGMGTPIPSDKLILELLRHTPIMLLLDEFQTWYNGLTNTKQYPWKNWAFNFIQILSEIAKDYPELLVLVVSVRDGTTDAYQQIHRVNPVQIDFKAGGSPDQIQRDRRHMLLHRLFENRRQIASDAIERCVEKHLTEYFRLLGVPSADHERKCRDFIEAWPYAPHLLQLLEDQVLVATDAQETRDMIRILANLFKNGGDATPILTAADFRLDEDATGIGALLDSVANQHHRTLREKASRNIIAVMDAIPRHAEKVPHLQEIVGALWLRSIAVGHLAGAEPAVLHVDITRNHAIDDNAFQVELAAIVENGFNIHQDGSRLVFREEENPQAKLLAYARNDKLFLDGSDWDHLAREIRYVIGGFDDVASAFHVIVLRKSWMSDPWSSLEDSDCPEQWDGRLPILVLPETPDRLNERLGRWLKEHLQQRRNTVRFLLPRANSLNVFRDPDLLILARVGMKALEWSTQRPEYKKLHGKYQGELREILKKRFDRFAVLNRWEYADPSHCEFHIEGLRVQGAQIPQAIETAVVNDLFVPEDLEAHVQLAAENHKSLGMLLFELQEPRPPGLVCIPWLGETSMKERVLRLCARGKIAINLRGMEYLQALPGEDEEMAWQRLRPKMPYTGRQMNEILLLLPSAVPTTGGIKPPSVTSDSELGGLFGDKPPEFTKPPANGETTAQGTGTATTSGGSLFDQAKSDRPQITLSNPATSPLNLIGKLESWNIGPATPVTGITLTVSSATGAQLKALLKKLPDGMTFALSLQKEEN
ncbi:MAG: DUF499 domain-containing protein [Magnetococcales bacterium]|nr:DUF499 domain-containing protein [Magnetococcales bacterium]